MATRIPVICDRCRAEGTGFTPVTAPGRFKRTLACEPLPPSSPQARRDHERRRGSGAGEKETEA